LHGRRRIIAQQARLTCLRQIQSEIATVSQVEVAIDVAVKRSAPRRPKDKGGALQLRLRFIER
jgi:hypothetical protein